MSKPLKKWSQKLLLILLTASLIFASSIVNANASVSSDFKVFVMGPLEKVTDFNAFKNQLIALKTMVFTGSQLIYGGVMLKMLEKINLTGAIIKHTLIRYVLQV